MSVIKSRINNYINQLRGLQQNVENTKEDPIGALVETLSGKYHKPYRMLVRPMQKQYLAQQERGFQSFLWQIKEFLQTVSVKKNNMPPEGNSTYLLRKFSTIEVCVKLETKIRKTISILTQIGEEDLIYNAEIHQHQKARRTRKRDGHYTILNSVEKALKELIAKKLAKTSPDWRIERIPPDVRKMAEKRKARSLEDQDAGERSLIHYVDFAGYAKIITMEDNWDGIFKEIFHHKEAILTKLKELEPIRNAVMHSRDISLKQIRRLELYANDLISAMKKA